MDKKILSIVVPSYNAAAYLPETMPSIFHSRYVAEIEVLIVNDGSTDHTLEIAREMEKDYPDIVRVIDKENGGHGSTVNVGIEQASGTYFKVVDADDWVETENLDALIDFLRVTDVDQIVSPYYRVYMDSGETILDDVYTEVQHRKIYQYDAFLEQTHHIPSMHEVTIKTNILRENGIRLGEKMFYVDMEYVCYPMKYLQTIAVFEKPVYRYRLGNIHQSVSLESYIRNRHMHQQVILNLAHFYNEAGLAGIRQELLAERIVGLSIIQMNIYFEMKDKTEARQELSHFERQLGEVNPLLLEGNNGKVIQLLRKTNYSLFPLASFYHKLRKK